MNTTNWFVYILERVGLVIKESAYEYYKLVCLHIRASGILMAGSADIYDNIYDTRVIPCSLRAAIVRRN